MSTGSFMGGINARVTQLENDVNYLRAGLAYMDGIVGILTQVLDKVAPGEAQEILSNLNRDPEEPTEDPQEELALLS